MLTKLDELLIVLWLISLAIGGTAALKAVGDEQMVLVFITGLTTVIYLAMVFSMFLFAHRRRYRAELTAQEDLEPDHVEGRMFYPGHGCIDTPRARGRSVVIDQAWTLLFVIPVGVYIVIAHGQWTIAVPALELTTIITMTAYANERETELDPAKQLSGCRGLTT